MSYILERLREKSTWLTILTLVGAVAGISISPELSEEISMAGMGIAGIIAIVTKEEKK
jgi:hypothetical protein